MAKVPELVVGHAEILADPAVVVDFNGAGALPSEVGKLDQFISLSAR